MVRSLWLVATISKRVLALSGSYAAPSDLGLVVKQLLIGDTTVRITVYQPSRPLKH